MATKENQRVTLTRRLLQEGLLELLEKQPIDKISVTELCRISGVNRSTFYNHFTAPQDVLADIETRMTQDLLDIASRHAANPATLECLEEICVYLKDHKKLCTILITFNADTDLVEVFRWIEQNCVPAKTCRRREADPDKLHLTSAFFCTGCYYMIREWLIRNIPKTPREVAELAYAFIRNSEAVQI